MRKELFILIRATALTGCILFAANTISQAPPAAAGPDFSKATEALGITATELSAAIGGPPPDFAGAAEKFGISVEEFLALLPAPPASDIPEGYSADDFMKAE